METDLFIKEYRFEINTYGFTFRRYFNKRDRT